MADTSRVAAVCDAIVQRERELTADDVASADRNALRYLDALLTRQITKDTGLLIFNGLMIAAVRTEMSPWPRFHAIGASVFAAVAVLQILRARWAEPHHYVSYGAELECTKVTLRRNSTLITVAGWASILAALCHLLALLLATAANDS